MKDQRVSEGCTPTPWRVVKCKVGYPNEEMPVRIETEDGYGVAITHWGTRWGASMPQDEVSIANAKMICLAVNEFGGLVEALKESRKLAALVWAGKATPADGDRYRTLMDNALRQAGEDV